MYADDDIEINFFDGGASSEQDALAALMGGGSQTIVTKANVNQKNPIKVNKSKSVHEIDNKNGSASRQKSDTKVSLETTSRKRVSFGAATDATNSTIEAAEFSSKNKLLSKKSERKTEIENDERDRVNDLRPDRANPRAIKTQLKSSQSFSNSKHAAEKTASEPSQRSRFESSSDSSEEDANIADDAVGLDSKSRSSSKDAVALPSAKHRALNRRDDPLQFHAKPRDLDGDQTAESTMPISGRQGAKGADYIFSNSPFDSLGLDPRLVEVLIKPVANGGVGLKTSTIIQSTVVPLLTKPESQASVKLSSSTRASEANGNSWTEPVRNILFKSETGSGKTIAFLLPILHGLMSLTKPVVREDGTRAVIISPTRELCVQITQVLSKLTAVCVNLVGGSIIGGEKKKSEKARLRKGVVILVATPGRLLDHMRTTECFKLQQLRYVVLDEADRLLDMGFDKTIMSIVALLRGQPDPHATTPATKAQPTRERQSGSASKNKREKIDEDSEEEGNDTDEKGEAHSSVTNKASGQTLAKKWSAAQASVAKVVLKPEKLVHLMASATITQSVKRLAMPIMGGQRFFYIDADHKTVDIISNAEDLASVQKERTRSGTALLDSANDKESSAKAASKVGGAQLEEAETMDAPKQLQQYHMYVSCKWRLAALISFLKAHTHEKVIVFFSTCDSADFHALLLRDAEWPSHLDAAAAAVTDDGSASNTNEDSEQRKRDRIPSIKPLEGTSTGLVGSHFPIFRLHGNVPQRSRQAIFQEFSVAQRGVLFCTDVAARGLDLPQIDWILQYDPPCETTDYIHRCGRTARKGKAGNALLFLLPSESDYTALLASHGLQTRALSLQNMFHDLAAAIPGAAKFKNTEEMAAVIMQRRLENTVDGCQPLLMAARQAFRSHIRAYSTHSSDSKHIFKISSLHLGHVARSFGLREPPKMLKTTADVLGLIANGHYAPKAERVVMPGDDDLENDPASRRAKKRLRDEKFALSRIGGNKKGRKGSRNDEEEEPLSVRDRKKEKFKKQVSNIREKQKLKPINSGGAARNRPGAVGSKAATGKASKAKIRFQQQMNSEFAQ